jgi:hypothetical protein
MGAVTVLSVALNRLLFPFYTGSLCFILDRHPSLPKIPFALHFEAFTYRLDCYRIYIGTVTRPLHSETDGS